jgi:hypothetical protein
MEINSTDIVNAVFDLWNNGVENEEVIIETIQSAFQLPEDDAESIFELIKTGYFRALIISAGQKYPKSNLANDPYVRAAQKRGLCELGHKPWWKFW